MNRPIAGILALLLGLYHCIAGAEQARQFGDYTVHYSAFTTDILAPEVAKAYQIQRSKNRALLNISILKKVMGTTGQPVKAAITATATNLSGQLRQLDVRELDEQGAVYYIAETPVNHEETLKYSLTIVPQGETDPLNFTFEEQFFTR